MSTKILIALIIISLMLMTFFIALGIVKIVKGLEGKKILITGMILGLVPLVLTTILLFTQIN